MIRKNAQLVLAIYEIIASGFLGDFDENEESFSVLSPAEGEKVYLTKVKAVIIYKDKDLTIQEFEWSSQK